MWKLKALALWLGWHAKKHIIFFNDFSKKLMKLDIANSVVRHLSVPKLQRFLKQVDEQLLIGTAPPKQPSPPFELIYKPGTGCHSSPCATPSLSSTPRTMSSTCASCCDSSPSTRPSASPAASPDVCSTGSLPSVVVEANVTKIRDLVGEREVVCFDLFEEDSEPEISVPSTVGSGKGAYGNAVVVPEAGTLDLLRFAHAAHDFQLESRAAASIAKLHSVRLQLFSEPPLPDVGCATPTGPPPPPSDPRSSPFISAGDEERDSPDCVSSRGAPDARAVLGCALQAAATPGMGSQSPAVCLVDLIGPGMSVEAWRRAVSHPTWPDLRALYRAFEAWTGRAMAPVKPARRRRARR